MSAALEVPVVAAEIEGERERDNCLGYGGSDVVAVDVLVELQRPPDHRSLSGEAACGPRGRVRAAAVKRNGSSANPTRSRRPAPIESPPVANQPCPRSDGPCHPACHPGRPARRTKREKRRHQRLSQWARLDSNQGPTDYESAALTS